MQIRNVLETGLRRVARALTRDLPDSRSLREPPCCAIGRFISRLVSVAGKVGSLRHVSVAGSRGPAKSGFLPISAGKASY